MSAQTVGARAARKATTRRRLVDTALATFRSQGYAATTIDDIASAAGTTRVTFYAHFASRCDVMRALIDELDLILGRAETADGTSTASELVEAVRLGTEASLGSWVRVQAGRWPAIRPYLLVAAEAAAIDPEIRGLVDGWFDEVIADIREGLDRADRFVPGSRGLRGELAVAQLDHAARHWDHVQPRTAGDPAIEVLVDSWVKLLGTT